MVVVIEAFDAVLRKCILCDVTVKQSFMCILLQHLYFIHPSHNASAPLLESVYSTRHCTDQQTPERFIQCEELSGYPSSTKSTCLIGCSSTLLKHILPSPLTSSASPPPPSTLYPNHLLYKLIACPA